MEPKDDMVIDDQANKSEHQILRPSKYSTTLGEQERAYTPLETRQYVCRTANAIRVLSTLGFTITIELIVETVAMSMSLEEIHQMLGSEFCVQVAEREAERRSSAKKKG